MSRGVYLPGVRRRLLAMRGQDEHVRAQLMEQGALDAGYHALMEQVHRANAAGLLAVIQTHGWPTERMVRTDGAEAAWLIAQHSIGQPDLMRRFRSLLDAASLAAEVPRWQFAYIDDRIRVFEGLRQRFGTQLDLRPDGLTACPIESPDDVDSRRAAVGLIPLQEALSRATPKTLPTPEHYDAKNVEERAWRKSVGWIT